MKAEHTERAAMLVKASEALPKFHDSVALPSHCVVLALNKRIGMATVSLQEVLLDAETAEKLVAALDRLIADELVLLGVEA